MVSLTNYLFARQLFHLSSSPLQMITVLHPSRIRHNGDTDAHVQLGPAPRILFRLRPCVNLFYCLLLIHIPRILSTIEKDANILACGHVRLMHVPGHQGLITKVALARLKSQRLNTLGSVRRREFGLICISSESLSLVKCWFAGSCVFVPYVPLYRLRQHQENYCDCALVHPNEHLNRESRKLTVMMRRELVNHSTTYRNL